MSDSQAMAPSQVLSIKVPEDLTKSSHLSSSVERLVEVTRRLTVFNQLESALDDRSKGVDVVEDERELVSKSDVPTEEEGMESYPKTLHLSETASATDLSSPDNSSRRSPNSSTKKWARLLGISPEDIGDEDEFIRAATAIEAHQPPSLADTVLVADQRALRQSWNAALDTTHFGSLESMEGSGGSRLRRSSSWKDKMSLPFFTKRCIQVKSIQQDELSKMIASGKPSYEQVHRWRKSFEALLTDKYGLALFKDFLATEFSDENIEFWIACEEYKTITQPKKQHAKAQKIYEDFIATQARREINLDSVTRDQTISELSSPSAHTFENAQKRIQALMERDSYGRFLRSDLYLTLLQQAKQAARELAAAARDGHDGVPFFSDGSARFKLPNFMGGGLVLGGSGKGGGGGGVGTDLPGVLAAAADAEAGMNSVQDLELLGLSTSRHMRNLTTNTATKHSASSQSPSPAKPPV
uniref:RGS domain-containing protein n=1 Tax=Mesocestoides corti TaxID=53468 RepID=A0A5K3FMN1_MESCO